MKQTVTLSFAFLLIVGVAFAQVNRDAFDQQRQQMREQYEQQKNQMQRQYDDAVLVHSHPSSDFDKENLFSLRAATATRSQKVSADMGNASQAQERDGTTG